MKRMMAIALSAVFLGGCFGGKCYVAPIQYREARRAFERTGSVALVREALEDENWPRCQINEAIYRIEKEFGLYDELPSPRRARSEEELLKEEEADAAARSTGIGTISLNR